MYNITYPAHYRKTDDMIQTVEEHLIGVSKLCSEFAKEHSFEYTGRLLGLLHDMGKYTTEFFKYISEGIHRDKEGLEQLNKTVDHGKYGAIFLYDRYYKDNLKNRAFVEILAMIICYHHGGLEDYINNDLDCKLINRCKLNDTEENYYKEACERLFERVMSSEKISELFQRATEEFQRYCSSREKLDKFDLHLLIKILYSCLIDADRYDTYCFIQNINTDEERISEKNISNLWEIFDQRLTVTENKLHQKRPTTDLEAKIHGLRQDIWKQCRDFGFKSEGIYTLTVPTGGGKTLSSLRYGINHAKKYNKRRIIYVLPFTTIIEQNAAVVRNTLDAGDYLLEHHSNVVYEDMNNNDNLTDEKWEYYRLLTERWTSPIIFTTMVQFLNTIFAGGTQYIRRLHNITDSVLIFDEIQALPIKCISLFNKAINYLYRECRNTIILCSATQPSLEQVEHPICINGEIIKNMDEKFKEFKRMNVEPVLKEGGMSIFSLAEFIHNIKLKNTSILVIMNTKSMAERVFKELKKYITDDKVFLYFLSTNLCPAHRKDKISEIKNKLKNGEHVICVSTQLIEAGVDISFSCVIRHLAGLDSIAQAAGRGNRNGEGEIKDAYIVQVEGEQLGSLDTIKYGEEATKAVLDKYIYNPECFDNDLLSPKALRYYYQNYYNLSRINEQMNYPIMNERETILEKLSVINKRKEYQRRYNKECPTILQYQFRTAARHFKVIDDDDISIVVPYSEGKNIILKLIDKSTYYPDANLIRQAQMYSVNISKKIYEKLKEQQAIEIIKSCGIMILNERFYDQELGVVTEGKKLDLLMY